MVCKNPFLSNAGMAFGCGQCSPCRVNRKRVWVHRLMLENLKHDSSMFLTLTYNDKYIPEDRSLNPDHLKNFIKRLRKAVDPKKIRYYAIGEYGDETKRPHYHAIIFGIGIENKETITKVWSDSKTGESFGHIYVGDVSKDSASYVVGYLFKSKKEIEEIEKKGLQKEFSRMSLRPGIGAPAVKDIVNALTTDFGHLALIEGDVPSQLSHGKTKAPLGRYLRKKIRESYGFTETGTPQSIMLQLQQKFKEEWQEALSKAHKKGKKKSQFMDSREYAKEILVDNNLQKIRNIETRQKIYQRKGKL